MSLGARIVGVGRSLPSRILTNSDIEKIVDTSDEWIVTRTGIKERRIAGNGVSASKLGAPAAKEALEKAGINPSDVDLILCATSTPDKAFPSTACYIQKEIGATGSPAFDISAACSGFTYGLEVANCFIRSGAAKNVLLVASEIFSRIIDWTDRSTCVLFGDGAAAVALAPSDGESGIISSSIHADGEYAELLKAGGMSLCEAPGGQPAISDHFLLEMKGKETFKVAVKHMSDVSTALLEKNGYKTDDLTLVIPHQANIRIINAVGKSLGIDEEKLFINVQKYGNTSAASVPLALYEAEAEGRLKKGDLALFVTFGGGLTWGAALIKW